MLRTMISLIDSDRAIHAQVHDALVDVGMAALSAEPTSVEQWRSALTRFVDTPVAEYMIRSCRPGIAQMAAEGGQVIIDMTARLLVVDTPIPDLPRLGNVQSCDESTTLDCWLPYRISDDWHIVNTAVDWDLIARQRREQVCQANNTDHRQILYGQLSSWLVEQWLERAEQLDEPTRQIQESWLLTPRDDLRGRTPRECLLSKRSFIDGDIQDQCQNWSLTGRCPPGLPPTSHAFLFGGYGSHEIILYHEMTVHLLLECERRLQNRRHANATEEVRHLEQLQQEWLHQPNDGLYDQSPAAVIARERARLPAVVPPGHAQEHDDCPLCRMMHDSGQPMFWQLDNFTLDDCFATSFYDSYAEWQETQEAWEQTCRRAEEEAPAKPSQHDDQQQHRVWQHSHTNMDFFDGMPPMEACAVLMFSIGGHMAELVQDLTPVQDDAGPPALDLCRQLHEQFDDLRGVLKEQEDLWMIQAATNDFILVLQAIARQRPDLKAKCADLEDKLDFLCDRYRDHADPYEAQDQS